MSTNLNFHKSIQSGYHRALFGVNNTAEILYCYPDSFPNHTERAIKLVTKRHNETTSKSINMHETAKINERPSNYDDNI